MVVFIVFSFFFFFFFQAEDGIRDLTVTGVQTCALPIYPKKVTRSALQNAASIAGLLLTTECLITELPEKEKPAPAGGGHGRSEERRVGKECRSRWSTYH